MEVEIRPGAKLDVLTKDELRDVIGEFTELFEHEVSDDVRASASARTDASGNATIAVYTVPAGMRFRLTRLVLAADGFTFGAPYTGAGYFETRRNGQMVDGGVLANNLPTVGTDGASAAARFKNADVLEVAIVGGPVSTNVEARIEGDLFPLRLPATA